MHNFSSSVFPSQFAPPCCGSGLSHLRWRVWIPSPHVTLHGPNSPHSPNIPFTVWKKEVKSFNFIIKFSSVRKIQVIVSVLQACCVAAIKPISWCVCIACSSSRPAKYLGLGGSEILVKRLVVGATVKSAGGLQCVVTWLSWSLTLAFATLAPA